MMRNLYQKKCIIHLFGLQQLIWLISHISCIIHVVYVIETRELWLTKPVYVRKQDYKPNLAHTQPYNLACVLTLSYYALTLAYNPMCALTLAYNPICTLTLAYHPQERSSYIGLLQSACLPQYSIYAIITFIENSIYIESSYVHVPALRSDTVYPAILFSGLFGSGRGYQVCLSHAYVLGTSPALTSDLAHLRILFAGLLGPVRGCQLCLYLGNWSCTQQQPCVPGNMVS